MREYIQRNRHKLIQKPHYDHKIIQLLHRKKMKPRPERGLFNRFVFLAGKRKIKFRKILARKCLQRDRRNVLR